MIRHSESSLFDWTILHPSHLELAIIPRHGNFACPTSLLNRKSNGEPTTGHGIGPTCHNDKCHNVRLITWPFLKWSDGANSYHYLLEYISLSLSSRKQDGRRRSLPQKLLSIHSPFWSYAIGASWFIVTVKRSHTVWNERRTTCAIKSATFFPKMVLIRF